MGKSDILPPFLAIGTIADWWQNNRWHSEENWILLMEQIRKTER